MSEILEELAKLERELVEELFGENAPDIVEHALAKVHRHTMLAARAVNKWALGGKPEEWCEHVSREAFPLPETAPQPEEQPMSEILERLATLEEQLHKLMPDADTAERDDRVAADIHRHTMLAAREVFVWAQSNAVGRSVAVLSAREIFHLPPRRVLRKEPDPDSPLTLYCCYEGVLKRRRYVGPWEEMKESSIGAAIKNSETPGAVAALFASLYAEPYREEPDERDR